MKRHGPKEVNVDINTEKNVALWLDDDYDDSSKAEIRRMLIEAPNEVVDAFHKSLSFGTGGLRGIMGVGPNRINLFTIRAATQGLANYLLKQTASQGQHSVLIGYDCRYHSEEFAQAAAQVLAANGIKVWLCEQLCPTPLVSFGCCLKKCSAGMMVTASHNPARYNGCKVFWSDGAQVAAPHDQAIVAEVAAIKSIAMVKVVDRLDHPLIEMVGMELQQAYINAIDQLENYRDDNHQHGHRLKVIYTSLHGTGISLFPDVCARWGFSQLSLVEEQVVPDGSFPTVDFPNPEDETALLLGIAKLKQRGADLLIANDPDGDRLGVVVAHQGVAVHLNGNQVAVLLLQHVCQALAEKNKLPANAAFVKTIVTGELFQAICDYYQKPCFNVAPGFKHIAEKIHLWESQQQGYQYVFGAEESLGYLFGTYTRDKDAIASAALVCEMALHAALQGMTLVDMLETIYRQYGVYHECSEALIFDESKDGHDSIRQSIEQLRRAPPKAIGGIDIAFFEDYRSGKRVDFATHSSESLHLPHSDLLLFGLKDGSKVVIRPSGTEPKIKIYISVHEKKVASVAVSKQQCLQKAQGLLAALKERLLAAETFKVPKIS
jgi:phosphoglucomutase/phosphomannomutase